MKVNCRNSCICWHSNFPTNWKIGTLRNLIKKAKSISFSKLLLRNEMSYLRNIFTTSTTRNKKVPKQRKETLPQHINAMTSYKRSKLSTELPVKEKTDFQQKNNVIFHRKCTSEGYHENYTGKTNRRIL